MKKSILMLLMFTIIIILSAQSETYSVDRLKLTDYEQMSLSLSNNTNGNVGVSRNRDYNHDKENTSNTLSLNLYKSKSNIYQEFYYRFLLDLSAGINTDDRQLERIDYYSNTHDKSTNYSVKPQIYGSFLSYKELWHWGINSSLFLRSYFSKNADFVDSYNNNTQRSSDIKTTSRESGVFTSTQFPLGYGRMYSYHEAYLAWMAVKDMEKAGCLNRKVTDVEIDDLTKVLFSLRSVQRLNLIDSDRERLTRIFDKLISTGFIKPELIPEAIAIFLDTWEMGESYKATYYSKTQSKRFGVLYEITPYFIWSYHKNSSMINTTDSTSYTNRKSINRFTTSGMDFGYTYNKPLKNVWLFSTSSHFYFGWWDVNSNTNKSTDWKPYTMGSLLTTLTAFPSVRSKFGVYTQFHYTENYTQTYDSSPHNYGYESPDQPDYIYFSLETGINSSYLLNKRTNLNTTIYYENKYLKTLKDNLSERDSDIYFNVSLQYNIF